MYFKFVLLALIVAAAMANESVEDRWAKFKTDFDRHFDAEEEARRYDIFKKNVKDIDDHNKRYDAGEVTWKAGINQFTDRTDEEKKSSNGYKPQRDIRLD